MLAPPPELDAWARQATHCWAFCGGWQPGHWNLYALVHGCKDWDLLIELMDVIKQNV
jgi:hypothetical protein